MPRHSPSKMGGRRFSSWSTSAIPLKSTPGYGPLKHILILANIANRRIRAEDFEVIAQFREKKLIVGPLGGGGVLPARDKTIERHTGTTGGFLAKLAVGFVPLSKGCAVI